MAREKRGKARAASPEIESSPSSDSEETHDAAPIQAQRKRKAVSTKVPKRAQSRGSPDPQTTLGQGSRARMKRASAPGSQGDDEGESLKYLEQMLTRITRPTGQARLLSSEV